MHEWETSYERQVSFRLSIIARISAFFFFSERRVGVEAEPSQLGALGKGSQTKGEKELQHSFSNFLVPVRVVTIYPRYPQPSCRQVGIAHIPVLPCSELFRFGVTTRIMLPHGALDRRGSPPSPLGVPMSTRPIRLLFPCQGLPDVGVKHVASNTNVMSKALSLTSVKCA